MVAKKRNRHVHMSSTMRTAVAQGGFLLPAIVALGLAIGTASILALQLVATNSRTLGTQSYTLTAKEAARAGVSAALSCISSQGGNRIWGTGGGSGTDTLTPKGCGAVTGKDYVIGDATAPVASTYSVSPVEDINSGNDTSSIITSTGIVTTKGPGTTRVEVAKQTIRTQFKTAGVAVGDPARKNVIQVSTGSKTACGLTADATVNDYWIYCWGDNSDMQIGAGRYLAGNRSEAPLAVYSGSTAQAVIPGTCAARDIFGNCYDWSPPQTPAQTATPMAGKRAVKVSVGNTHTCAIAQDGTDDTTRRAYCWGRNNYGQLGDVSTTDSLIPIAVDTSAARPAVMRTPSPCGGWFQPSCTPVVDIPAKPASAIMGKTIVDISAGNGFTCALASDGLVSCWGRNSDGQLGNNSTTDSSTPVPVSQSSTRVQKLAVVKGGATTMCAVTTANDGLCWGKSDVGQTGNGATIDPATRRAVYSLRSANPNQCNTLRPQVLSTAQSMAGGSPHADTDNPTPITVTGGFKFDSITVNDSVQSGDTYENITAGTSYGPNNDVIARGSISAYVTAKGTNNRVYYWGGERSFNSSIGCVRNSRQNNTDWSRADAEINRSYSGTSTPQLLYDGTSGTLNRSPVGVMSGNAFNNLFCATSGGNVYCDGNGSDTRDGQVGDGRVVSCSWNIFTGETCNPTSKSRAVQVSTLKLPTGDTSSNHTSDLTPLMAQSVSDLDTGTGGYTCAVAATIATSSTVLCWGTNDRGQLGTNNRDKRYAPTFVYTGDTAGLGKSASGGGGGTVRPSGVAAINTNNGLPQVETIRNF